MVMKLEAVRAVVGVPPSRRIPDIEVMVERLEEIHP
jgi:hypothetical protein